MKLARCVPVLLASVVLVSCMSSEQRAIETYFTEAQNVAERLVEAASEFSTLMNAQSNPLQWSAEDTAKLDTILETFEGLKDEAEDMSVPEALEDIHPLLVESLGDMTAAVEIIVNIAHDPTTASMEKAQDMTANAENAEKLAGEYVQKLQSRLEEKYPELLQE